MPKIKFNSSTAASRKPEKKSVVWFATNFNPGYPGSLCMRVSPKGKKTWLVTYRLPGNTNATKLTLGTYPDLSFTDAKKKAADMLKDISEGADPRQEKQERLAAPTVDVLWEDYFKFHGSKKKSASQDKNYYENRIRPTLGNRKAEDVKRRDIIHLLDDITESSPVTSNRVLSLLSVMFNVGIDRELISTNPCFRIKKNKEISRDRVLTAEEIVSLWEQWELVRMGNIFKIKLMTAQRDAEVIRMRWDQIKDNVWIIPANVTKNGKKHEVPLSKQAQEILDTIERRGDYVFYSARGKSGHVRSTAKCFRECRASAGLPRDVRGHDLRRTAASGMAELGISEAVIGRVLNHSEHGVTNIYNRHGYMIEKLKALQKWADKLDRMLGKSGSKIIELRRAAG